MTRNVPLKLQNLVQHGGTDYAAQQPDSPQLVKKLEREKKTEYLVFLIFVGLSENKTDAFLFFITI